MITAHRALHYRPLPVLRAENAPVLIHPDDRKYGALLVGSMGSGKTAALLRLYANDLLDENTAIIIIDPKSELSRLCLALTPPDCGKRVWFLDLGRPAFGMSPLRLTGEGALPIQAAAVAENIVAALLDINENQIFQSSRRYLYHAVIGAIALAQRQQRRAKFEDVYTLLLPTKQDFRAPDSLRELVFLDRVNEIGPADQLDGAPKLPRLYNEDYAVLALLDRAGLVPRSLIARGVFPNRTGTAVHDRLTKLHRHGLIARHPTGLREHTRNDGKPPLLYSLTRRGLEVAQTRTPTPAISPKREWRPIDQARAARLAHDLHGLGWAVELHHTVGALATDHWRTPRYATGRYPVPHTGSGQRRHPITLNEIPVPDGQAIIDVELKTFTEVKPDLSLELRIAALNLTFDLLVELDLTARASYNHDKFVAYDAFLCGWSLAHSATKPKAPGPR